MISAAAFVASVGLPDSRVYAECAAAHGLVPDAVCKGATWFADQMNWEFWWDNYPTAVLSVEELERQLGEMGPEWRQLNPNPSFREVNQDGILQQLRRLWHE